MSTKLIPDDKPRPQAATIHEMTRKATEGLQKASEVVKDDKTLLNTIAILAQTYDQLAGNLIIVASGLSAFRTQSPEIIRERLVQMHIRLTATEKKLQPTTFEDFIGKA